MYNINFNIEKTKLEKQSCSILVLSQFFSLLMILCYLLNLIILVYYAIPLQKNNVQVEKKLSKTNNWP